MSESEDFLNTYRPEQWPIGVECIRPFDADGTAPRMVTTESAIDVQVSRDREAVYLSADQGGIIERIAVMSCVISQLPGQLPSKRWLI